MYLREYRNAFNVTVHAITYHRTKLCRSILKLDRLKIILEFRSRKLFQT